MRLIHPICVAVMLIIASACEKYEPDWDIFEAYGVAEYGGKNEMRIIG